MKKSLLFAAVMACSIPAFAFTSGASQRDIDAEVSTRVKNGESLEAIANAAHSAGVTVNPISLALTFYGDSSAVLAGLIQAGYAASDAINALVALGANRATLNQVAIARGVDPTTLVAATAAGGATGANVTGNFGGFSGNSFSASRSSTIGGGGRSSVSPS